MVDLKNLGLQPGQKLRITTKNLIIIGKFNKLSKDATRMEISQPQKLDGSGLGKFLWVSKGDVQEIKAEKLAEQTDGTANGTTEKEAKIFNPSFSKLQIDRVNRMMKEEVLYIYQINCDYYKALADISESFWIGLYAENSGQGRFFKAEFLQLSTNLRLYVFDLRQLKIATLFEDLRTVFESQAYLKIVFDSRFLLDNLKKHFNVQIAPVCDLQVVLSLERGMEIENLSHCLMEVFGISYELQQKNSEVWLRPVNDDQLARLSSKVAFLIPIYAQLNQIKLLQTYGDALKEYSTLSKENYFNEVYSVANEKLHSVVQKFQEKN